MVFRYFSSSTNPLGYPRVWLEYKKLAGDTFEWLYLTVTERHNMNRLKTVICHLYCKHFDTLYKMINFTEPKHYNENIDGTIFLNGETHSFLKMCNTWSLKIIISLFQHRSPHTSL